MKISYCSDLHLEHHSINLNVFKKRSDVLILAGDIVTIKFLMDSRVTYALDFFKYISDKNTHVIYVIGNHELYASSVSDINLLKMKLAEFKNIHILDNEGITIGDVDFFGGTCWTDFNKMDAATMISAPRCIVDYRLIGTDNRLLQVDDVLQMHEEFKSSLADWLKIAGEKRIVISHHSPSVDTIADIYKSTTVMNGLFYSDLDIDNTIDYWIYGHMHSGKDVIANGTSIVTNPRGYPNEFRNRNFNLRSFDYGDISIQSNNS